jgi:hypothetical protein
VPTYAAVMTVKITQLEKAFFHVAPNPCHAGLDGISFSNATDRDATVDLTGVPGYGSVKALIVPAGKDATAVPASATQEGEFAYRIAVGTLKPKEPADASPRVILDY